MEISPEDFDWGPLFAGLEAASVPQTGALPTISIRAAVPPPEVLRAPCEALGQEAPFSVPCRKTDALEDTFWILREFGQGGIILRDGPADRWYEEALWVPGSNLGRSYAIVFGACEYEFHSRLRLRNQKREVYQDPVVQQPPAEAA